MKGQVEWEKEDAMQDAQEKTDSTEIVHIPGVCGGRAIFKGTRKAIWHIIAKFKYGMTDEQYLSDFPSMTHEHLRLAREYYENHKAEILADIAENEED